MSVTRYLLAGLAIGLVVVMIVLGVKMTRSSQPLLADAPPAEFSATRGLTVLRELTVAPRPLGSPANDRARAILVAKLAEMGLAPRVQSATVVSPSNRSVAGTVRNVVARLPGLNSTRAVVLVAHYDSVAISPGAADDGSGVCVLLETARALSGGPRLRNDVVFLFTDGEERGMLGARAFIQSETEIAATGLVLNVDSPGSSTGAIMYETGAGNGELVRELSQASSHAATSSLLYEVSRRFPPQTDLRSFLAAGIPGMSFAALDGPAYNHTGYDDVAHFEASSLQHQGETVLELTRHFGDLDLRRLRMSRAPDVVFFDIGGKVLVYDAGLALPFLAGAGLVLSVGLAVATRRRLVRLRGVALSLLAVPGVLAAALLVMAIVWGMYRTAYAQRTWSDVGMVISDYYRLGLVLLALASVVAAYSVLLLRLRVWDLAAAALIWWLLSAGAVCVLVPGASYLLTWPLAAAALALLGAALCAERADGWPAAFLALLGAAPAAVLVTGATYMLLVSEGLKQVITVVAVWLVTGLLLIPLDAVRRVFKLAVPAGLGVAGVVVLFVAGTAVAAQAEHPHFTSVHYRIDAQGMARWQTVDPVDEWTRRFVGADAHMVYAASYFPQLGMKPTTEGVAPRLRLPAPRIQVLEDVVRDDRRIVRLRLVSPRKAAVLSLLLHTVAGRITATVNGQTLAAKDTAVLDNTSVRWKFDYYSPPDEGLVVTLRFAAGPSVLLRAVDCSYGLPESLVDRYAARPSGMLPGGIGDTTLVESALRLPASAGSAGAIPAP